MDTNLTVSEAAKFLRRAVKTLQKWDRSGVLKSHRTATNRRYYHQSQLLEFLGVTPSPESRESVAYCRVSSAAQRGDLKNQKQAVAEFCIARGLANVSVIEEIGGGLNFKRKAFLSMIDRIISNEIDCVVIAHKDRLARFGFDLLKHLCESHNCKLLVIDSEVLSPEAEMVRDLMTIMHCFSSRLYGLRNYRKTLKAALK